MAHPDDCLVTQKRILTYYTRIFVIGPNVRSHCVCTSARMYVEPM